MSKGWKRLWVSFAIGWFGSWAAIAAFANWQIDILISIARDHPHPDPQWALVMSEAASYNQLVVYSVWCGVFAPILAIPFIGLAYWTYCGFRTDQSSQTA